MKIGLLATGDELTTGDILNTNGQTIAQLLFDAGFHIGNHVMVSDVEIEIINSIKFLKQDHDVIIITGGLGPTSDDRTRFALAKANHLELFFHEPSWQSIIKRLHHYGLYVHESNKQQAYFPVDAIVLENPHGTASGCQLLVDDTLFFMLPGPPRECLPMFTDFVLPFLIQHDHEKKYSQRKWRLFGVSEGEIAATLDTLVKDFPVTTGYRWDYPYIEFKLRYADTTNIDPLLTLIEEKIQPFSICTSTQTASELCIDQLKQITTPLTINDTATGGLLAHRLIQPDIFEKIKFVSTQDAHVYISGLNELWQNQSPHGEIELQIKGAYNSRSINQKIKIPFRNRRIVEYAVEMIAYQLKNLLM